MTALKNLFKNKWLKYCSLILGVFIALLFMVLGFATIYVKTHKAALIGKVKEALSAKTRGDVQIGDISVGFWKTFPFINVGVEDISISDSVYHRPLFKMEEIYGSINIFPLITGSIALHKVHLRDGLFKVFTDSSGYSNSYLLSSKDTSSIKKEDAKGFPKIHIGAFDFQNVQFGIENRQKNKNISVFINEITAKIREDGDTLRIRMHQDCLVDGLGFKLANGSFLRGKHLKADWVHMRFNRKTLALTFDETPVTLGQQIYNIGGGFNFSSDSAVSKLELNVNSKSTTFEDAGSLLSQNIQEKLKMVQWKGPIDVVARLSGSLQQSTPRIQVQVNAVESSLLLPGDIQLDSCFFVGAYLNQIDPKKLPDDTNSQILLTNFKANWNGVPLFSKTISVNDLIHPKLNMHFRSHCDLADLDSKFNFNTVRLLSGRADMELEFNGPILSASSVLQNIAGKIVLNKGAANYVPRNFLFNNISGTVLFNGQHLSVQNMRCDLNKNRFLINVTGDNVGSAAMGSNVAAKVICSVNASTINLQDFMAIFGTSSPNTPKSSTGVKKNAGNLSQNTLDLDNLLQKGTLYFNFAANNLIYKHLRATNLRGALVFRPSQWEANKVSFTQGAGYFRINSVVNPYNNYNDAKVDVQLSNVDIQNVMYSFDNFGMNGLSFRNIKGKMNLKGSLKTRIDNNGHIVSRSTNGDLRLALNGGELINFEPLLDIQKIVFKKRDLAHIRFAPIDNTFNIRRGGIYIHRMEIASTALRLFVEGIYSPNGITDLAIQVPLKSLLNKQDKKQALDKNGIHANVGASVWLKAQNKKPGDPVSIKLDLFKAFRKDKIEERFEREFGADQTGK